MDGVCVNGRMTDGVNIFGTAAVKHMDDVKSLMLLGVLACQICAVLLPLFIIYIICRRRECASSLLGCTLVVYAALLGVLLALVILSLLTSNGDFFSSFWMWAHFLLFPFDLEKVMGSFFSDTLTMILTLDLFMDAVVIVLSSLATALALWLFGIFSIRRNSL